MGCCLSSIKFQENDPNNQGGLKAQHASVESSPTKSKATHEFAFRAPPPVEEETVKEVLSETPISKPLIPELIEERKTQMAVTLIQPKVECFETKGGTNKADEVSERSQSSEICSVSSIFSTATTATTATLTDKREDEVRSKLSSRKSSQRVNRSPANAPRKRPYTADSGGVRERRAKSSLRKTEPSPEKKSLDGTTSSVRGSESAQLTTRKLNVAAAGIRRHPGKVSRWRSKSPSNRGLSGTSKVNCGRSALKASENGGSLLPAKRVNKVRAATPARYPDGGRSPHPISGTSKVNCGRSALKASENGGSLSPAKRVNKVREKNDDVPHNAHESLENPHVSLECFIFL